MVAGVEGEPGEKCKWQQLSDRCILGVQSKLCGGRHRRRDGFQKYLCQTTASTLLAERISHHDDLCGVARSARAWACGSCLLQLTRANDIHIHNNVEFGLRHGGHATRPGDQHGTAIHSRH